MTTLIQATSVPRLKEPVEVISTSRVFMTYGSGSETIRAVQGVDLNIDAGQIVLLMGPSGSGKTTLLSILAGILTPTSGSVEVLGEEINEMSSERLARFRLKNIGFVFQGFNLLPALTAQENVEVVLNLKGIRGREARLEAQDLLEQVGLGNKIHSFPRDLSGGQKQRVSIARALAGDPPLIMADEPTASLDSQTGRAVVDLLRTLARERNRTVLMVTHDPRILDVADRIIYMEDGHVVSHNSELAFPHN
ncbi:ABC transporter ATP-binding protein [Leptolyngbya sp. FACHB-261]|uniref:ABC transporter ATP-binding protein n=1 Tax=Leptolyngbya sp. FACHB-261 TaxID=2692806 RepID=UPI0016893676|nr:ABC transporter ATP-binding protein [Leptolyngbya sp. FACHB-261]MBD2103207.1 ABC transporter ATP-binding protein [Leptolyngbya sp. FACHB-261]